MDAPSLFSSDFGISNEEMNFEVLKQSEVVDSMRWYLSARSRISTIICSTAIVLGVLLKVLVIIVTLRNKNIITTAIGWLVVSLMAAGLVHLLFVVPMNIAETANRGWHYGETFCRVHRYIWFVCLYSIEYHLVLILVYLFVSLLMYRRGNNVLERPFVGIASVVILWAIILLANISNLLSHGVVDDIPGMTYCYPKAIYNKGIKSVRRWMLASFLSMYVFPAILMSVFTVLIWWTVCTRNAPGYGRFDCDLNFRTRWDYCLTASIIKGVFMVCWSPRLIHAMLFAFREDKHFTLKEVVANDVFAFLLHAVFPVVVPIVFLTCVREYRARISMWCSLCCRKILLINNQHQPLEVEESASSAEVEIYSVSRI